jgi:DNA-binding NarL/FixJ family response regulator
MTVALVNDDEIIVRGLDAMLQGYGDRVNLVELGASKLSRTVDIVLYDPSGASQRTGPGIAGLIADPRVSKVVVYTSNFQPWLARETMAQGVCGYLSKSLSAAQLVEALHMVHAGQKVLSPSPGRRGQVGGDWPGREEGLTAREAEVLSLITMGLSNLEIAERTSLSVNSIKSYIRSCYRKIDVDSRSKAVLWGMAHGLRSHPLVVQRPLGHPSAEPLARRMAANPGA